MAFTSKLADLFVQFTAKGIEGVTGAMQSVQTRLGEFQKGVEQVGKIGTVAFATLSGSLTGWIVAGTQGTAIAMQFHFQMERLSRTIAGLFRPELQKLVDWLRQVTDWFRRLTPEQREQIVQWTKAALAASAVAMIMPKIVGGVQAVIGVLTQLAGVLGIIDVETGGILPAIGMIVTALAALAVGTQAGRDALGEWWDMLKPLVGELMKVGKAIMEALAPIMPILAQVMGTVIKALVPIIQFIGKVVEGLAAIAKPIIEILGIVVGAVAELAGEIIDALSPIAEAFGELFASFGELLGALGGALVPVVQFVVGLLKGFLSILMQIAKVIIEVVMAPIRLLAWALRQIADAINTITGRAEKATPKKAARNEDRGPMAGAPSGFMAVDEAYRQIAQQSAKMGGGVGKSTQERQLEVNEQQLAEQQKTNQLLDVAKSPFKK